MRYWEFLIIFATLHQIKTTESRDLRAAPKSLTETINEKLRSFLEGFKDIMKTGQPILGIPILEPFELKRKEFVLEDGPILGKYEVTDLIVENLSNYIIQNQTNFQFLGFTITLDILWPLIKGNTSYKANGTLFDRILFFGAGDLSFRLHDFHFISQAKLKYEFDTKKVSVVSLNGTTISLGESEMNITGLYNDDKLSEMVSPVVSDLIPETLEEFQDEVTTLANGFLRQSFNQMLNKYSLDDLMSLFSGSND